MYQENIWNKILGAIVVTKLLNITKNYVKHALEVDLHEPLTALTAE